MELFGVGCMCEMREKEEVGVFYIRRFLEGRGLMWLLRIVRRGVRG